MFRCLYSRWIKSNFSRNVFILSTISKSSYLFRYVIGHTILKTWQLLQHRIRSNKRDEICHAADQCFHHWNFSISPYLEAVALSASFYMLPVVTFRWIARCVKKSSPLALCWLWIGVKFKTGLSAEPEVLDSVSFGCDQQFESASTLKSTHHVPAPVSSILIFRFEISYRGIYFGADVDFRWINKVKWRNGLHVRETKRQRDTHTNRQTDSQISKQTNRQTGR